MQNLDKVNEKQLFYLWRNLSVCLLALVVMMSISKMFVFYLSPVWAIITTGLLYGLLIKNKVQRETTCMVVVYGFFYGMISYSFITIIINVMWMWGIIPPGSIPREYIFFEYPFVPSLYMAPIFFVTFLIMYLRRNRLSICRSCKLEFGNSLDRGLTGSILNRETRFQMGNLMFTFGALTAIIYAYYWLFYVDIAVNARDWYIYTWIVVITFLLDMLYFIFRYYNLYLDMKENDELVTDAELDDMAAKTYLRFYVCCGNYVYIDPHVIDPKSPFRESIDTPFITNRSVNGIAVSEVRHIIERMTGYRGGELRFYYGRNSRDFKNQSILRYFYFLDGTPEDYPDLRVDGEWMDFNAIKQEYTRNPNHFTTLGLADISRLATIMITEKVFNEKGYRKNRLKSYNPTFNLKEVRESRLDFQDNKWIKISQFNSDIPFYALRRWWRGITGVGGPQTTHRSERQRE